MYDTSDLKKGLKIEMEGDPYIITDFQFSKPGKGQAMYRCKLKNLLSGSTSDKTYRSGDKVGKPDLMDRTMSYSYNDGTNFVFMNDETFEQLEVSPDLLGNNQYFLAEDMPCSILFHNDKVIDISLPNFVDKVIIETEPGFKGDTSTNTLKPAKVENDYEIHVPLFINEGDTVRIDTRTGDYSERVSKA